MTLLAPWSLLGLLALALPILIHLLTRRSARVLRLPTLRFIGATRLHQARILRPSDPLLLAVRCGVLAAAACALAQPQFGNSGALERRLARVVVVDTSASMGAGITDALEAARQLADSADVGLVVATAAPSHALAGAAEWLDGRGEVVVVSDFRVGAVEEADVRRVPAEVGLSFRRVQTTADTAPPDMEFRRGQHVVTLRTRVLADGATRASWTVTPATESARPAVRLADDAALEAAVMQLVPIRDTTRAIVVGGAAGAGTPAAWMGDVLAAVPMDVVAAAGNEGQLVLSADSAAQPVVALHAARALARLELQELEPASLPDSVLTAWQRAAVSGPLPTERSDGRWFWLLALALLAVESWLRRQRP